MAKVKCANCFNCKVKIGMPGSSDMEYVMVQCNADKNVPWKNAVYGKRMAQYNSIHQKSVECRHYDSMGEDNFPNENDFPVARLGWVNGEVIYCQEEGRNN